MNGAMKSANALWESAISTDAGVVTRKTTCSGRSPSGSLRNILAMLRT